MANLFKGLMVAGTLTIVGYFILVGMLGWSDQIKWIALIGVGFYLVSKK